MQRYHIWRIGRREIKRNNVGLLANKLLDCCSDHPLIVGAGGWALPGGEGGVPLQEVADWKVGEYD
jgi:hypothetical protein